MGGGRSSTRTKSSTATSTQNLNLQGIEGTAVAGVGGNVTLSDQGAIKAAGQAFSETIGFATAALTSSANQNEIVAGLAGTIAAQESGNDGARLESITKYGLIGAGLIVAAFMFKGS